MSNGALHCLILALVPVIALLDSSLMQGLVIDSNAEGRATPHTVEERLWYE